ncbi:MAG TPA: hypothetical protein VF894_03195 [Anaeromyxobacter sp.]
MRRTTLIAALTVLPVVAGAAPRVKIAVTDIRSVQGVAPGTATILSDIVVSEVARAGYDVVSQADITAMIGFEKQKKVLGCSEDSSCLAEIGGALGVDFMLTGQVGQIGTRNRVSLLVVDTKKARVVARSAQFSDQDEDALVRAAELAVKEILAGIRAAQAVAQAPAATPPPAKVAPLAATPPPGKGTPPAAAAATGPGAKPTPSLAAVPPPQYPAAAQVSTSASPRWSARRTAYVTMGGGGVLLLTGAVLGLSARSKYNALDAKQGQFGYYDSYQAEKGAIRTRARAADALMVTGAAVTGVGGWLWWRSGRTRVSVVPSAADGSVGLVASGSF